MHIASRGEIVAMLKSPPCGFNIYAGQCLARPSMYVPGGLLYAARLSAGQSYLSEKAPFAHLTRPVMSA